MKCPLCGSGGTLAFEAKGYGVADCSGCMHRFADISGDESHVSSHYGDGYFFGGGAGYSDYLSEGSILQARGRMYARKIAAQVPAGRMLDVGAAAGYVLKGFTQEGWTGVGLEPNGAMVEHGKAALGLEMVQASLESFDTSERFDLVSMIQVAAHFYDPKLAFQKAAELLKDDGHLLIETWDRGSVSARVLGKHWHEYSPPSVLNWFSKESLRDLLSQIGFEQVAIGRPSKKISGGHVRSLLKYRLGDNFLLKLIPESVNFPYPSEDLFWSLYRKKTSP